jgi:tetratricopeptide (TPR) repeat protein
MKFGLTAAAITLAFLLLQGAPPQSATQERLARHRNLGKAFYENPTTQKEAVEQFALALKMAPDSVPEQLNYGLALLRAGKTAEGVAELEKVQKRQPDLPHTWFNLGIIYKKNGDQERATQQFERMVKLVPDEPISHYNLGALYRLAGRAEMAIAELQTAAKLDPNLAAAHFQLYNAFRTSGRMEEARRELEIFQRLKKQQEGAVIPEDVEWSAYAEIYDVMGDGGPAAPATLRFAARATGRPATGAVAFDVNADGRPELLGWSKSGAYLEPGLEVTGLKEVTATVPGDYNNDGFMDVCFLTPSGPTLYENHKGTLQASPLKLPAGEFTMAVWLDYDHDNDPDLFLLGKHQVLLRNQGTAGFVDQTSNFPFVSGEALDATITRVVADTKGFDLVVSYKDRGAVLYRDKLQGRYAAEDLPIPAGADSLTTVDANNDGWLDIAYASAGQVHASWNNKGVLQSSVVLSSLSGGIGFAFADLENRGVQDLIAGASVARNVGGGKFNAPQKIEAASTCGVIKAADVNLDGRIDVFCAGGGTLSILTNQTATKNNWIRVRLIGVKAMKLAAGSEVEVKAGARYQKQLYDGTPLHFGLGRETQADTVRITWPNGLIQNEMRQAGGRSFAYQEAQRLSGSCPIIWTWNGNRFEYITDVLGVAPLGASSGDGQYFPVDHNEYIQIPGRALVSADGHYEIRITEELSEVAYLDHVRLIAVDHPAAVDVFTNEKFKGPPFPEFRLFGVRKRVAPVQARDEGGRDVRRELSDRDRTYPDRFARSMPGVAGLHHLDLDFGKAAPDGRAVLVLSGWVDWADGSTFLGVAQEGRGGLVTPFLQMKDPAGVWKTVIEDMGMPAGKPKSIVVDLSGKWLSASREVRIVTNLCVYWDEIFLSEDTSPPDVRLTGMNASAARLRFRGFSPSLIHPERKQPEQFSYLNAAPTSLWNPTPGTYTRYGDVRELVVAVDDRMIVMGSGDELRLQFDAQSLPPLAIGWKRDFLLLVDGWAKDRDANTAYSQNTDPLPFHGMSSYPYPPAESYPDTPKHRDYRSTYNTRPALTLIRPVRP